VTLAHILPTVAALAFDAMLASLMTAYFDRVLDYKRPIKAAATTIMSLPVALYLLGTVAAFLSPATGLDWLAGVWFALVWLAIFAIPVSIMASAATCILVRRQRQADRRV
jgi:hypothetical protein